MHYSFMTTIKRSLVALHVAVIRGAFLSGFEPENLKTLYTELLEIESFT